MRTCEHMALGWSQIFWGGR